MIIRFGEKLEHFPKIGSSEMTVSLTIGNTKYSLYNIDKSLRW